MSYIVPFQSIALFEQTFRQQLNPKSGKIDEREFVFNQKFGDREGQLTVEADRYRLIWMPGCPHSNKAVITLRLLGLDRVISVGECGVLRDPRGWVFSEDLGQVDPVLKIHYLDDAYLKGDPTFTGRSTVPAIVDTVSGAVVQNEAWDIPRYLVTDWQAFHKPAAPDLYPEALRPEIDQWSRFINHRVNAYTCGFARDQATYDQGYQSYFSALDELEERLSHNRFVNGDYISLSDIHLFVALIRFHINYHLVFGVNQKRLQDYPNLWGYTREVYQIPAFYQYTKLEAIKRHYQLSPHMRAKQGNVYGLQGTGPDNRDLLKPTGRERLSADPDHVLSVQTETRPLFAHTDPAAEVSYLNQFLLEPLNRAGKARWQTELERWSNLCQDCFEELNERLLQRPYLLGGAATAPDLLLFKTLKRFDQIYYYLYRLNFAKTTDYPGLAVYQQRLQEQPEFKPVLDIGAEKAAAFHGLSPEQNPYDLVFQGPAK